MTQSNSNMLLGEAIMLFVPLYFILQIWLGIAWTGRWRLAALFPLIGFLPALAFSLMALSQNSNLWPIMMIFFAPVACIYFLGAGIVRIIRNPRRAG